MRILCVGIATLDIVNTVAEYPKEDAEVRSMAQRRARGGNATNTLVVLSQQGHSCSWAGVLPKEPDAAVVEEELRHYFIKYDYCSRPQHGKLPTSYIVVSESSRSRTIVHYRDMPEYSFEAFDSIPLEQFDWVHFEGRAVDQLAPMLQKVVSRKDMRCSVEVEKPRTGLEELISLPDVIMYSRHYAESKGHDQPHSFLQYAAGQAEEQYLTWGEQGAWAIDKADNVYFSPAYPPGKVRDTLGAGDVFNAGIIHGRSTGQNIPRSLAFACRLAGIKCGLQGFEGVRI